MTCSPVRRLGLLAGLAVVAAGCGGGGSEVDVGAADEVAAPPGLTTTLARPDPAVASTPATPTAPASGATAEPLTPGSILPPVRLTDVRSGATVDLATLVPAQQPLLLWFWAPH